MLVTILPLYHMFEATISTTLEPREENFKEDPPQYEMSPLSLAGITPVPSTAQSSINGFPFPPLDDDSVDSDIFNQGSADLWERTVLANVHKLETLADKSSVPKHLNVSITFTEEVGQKGVAPTIVDISQKEFRQGDFIHGYVSIENTSNEPIPFDMVYVVFEGTLAVVHTSKGPADPPAPPTVYKFLNMIDLFALWLYANIDRLATDNGDPHDWCDGETDPYDGTLLAIDVKRLFQPGVRYKRFFSFRVPEKLLDDNCEIHSLDVHCQVPPSVGHPVNLAPHRRHHQPLPDRKLKDFALLDSFITYNVAARVIGRASHYLPSVTKDRYVMARDATVPLRVIPLTGLIDYRVPYNQQIRAHYKALVEAVEDKILRGRAVLEGSALPPPSAASRIAPARLALPDAKTRHLHTFRALPATKPADADVYQHVSPYRKKTLAGFSRALGVFSLSTPKAEYCIPYVPPPAFRTTPPPDDAATTIRVPLYLVYSAEADGKGSIPQPPEPKKVLCELVALTVRSKKHFIPVEFNHEMCFPDYVVDDPADKHAHDHYDNFDSLVVRPFADYYHQLVTLMKKIGFDNEGFKVETQLFRDIKSLAMLQTKSVNLVVPDVQVCGGDSATSAGSHRNIQAVPWTQTRSTDGSHHVFTKQMTLLVNINSAYLKGTSEPSKGKSAFDYFCLVPDFQVCLMARFYYIRVTVRHANGASQVVNVPLQVRR